MHLAFHRNISNVDRIIRIIAGIVLIYLAVFNPFMMSSWLSLILGIVGVAMIIEGVLAY
jgi:predicted phage tail protein